LAEQLEQLAACNEERATPAQAARRSA
jgi:hypothetical protein